MTWMRSLPISVAVSGNRARQADEGLGPADEWQPRCHEPPRHNAQAEALEPSDQGPEPERIGRCSSLPHSFHEPS
jgi:hypothetical protein